MKNQHRRSAFVLRRIIQTLSLLLFFWLLGQAARPDAESFPPPDLYPLLDPLADVLAPITARAWISGLWLGLLLLLFTMVFGRIFCGYICPMGITLDVFRGLLDFFTGRKPGAPGRESKLPQGLRQLKYLILAAMLAAALLGVNTIFWGAPISLITRFYALLAYPLLLLGGEVGLSLARPLADGWNIPWLSYLTVPERYFDTLHFVLIFFALLFALELARPRFWCRYLCPAGALLALFGRKPLWRRRVAACLDCGQCRRICPTGAISADGLRTAHSECIACRGCLDVCPARVTADRRDAAGASCAAPASYFSFRAPAARLQACGAARLAREREQKMLGNHERESRFLPSRRAFVGALGLGAVAASVQYAGAHSLLLPGRKNPAGQLIRPPGALPETDFLARCTRCGLCMQACPSNGLQPCWLAGGVEGLFSPALKARIGPCEPDCNLCGRVCPTQAVRALPLAEKKWAKIGNAVILKQRCLAWNNVRRCMVCQEVCPYGAIEADRLAGTDIPTPVVRPERCFGCGYCERHCPAALPAIVIEAAGALRLTTGSYIEAARNLNLDLDPAARRGVGHELGPGDLPPGFSE